MATTVSAKLYEILCLPHFSSIPEVRTAYKTLALKYHPDKNIGDPSALEKFKEVKEAYEMLSNEEKKKRYDMQLRVVLRTMNDRKGAPQQRSSFQMRNMTPQNKTRRQPTNSSFSKNPTPPPASTSTSSTAKATPGGTSSSSTTNRTPNPSATKRRNFDAAPPSNTNSTRTSAARPRPTTHPSYASASQTNSGRPSRNATPLQRENSGARRRSESPVPPLPRAAKLPADERLRRLKEAQRLELERQMEIKRQRDEQKAERQRQREEQERERERREQERWQRELEKEELARRSKAVQREELRKEQQDRTESLMNQWKQQLQQSTFHSRTRGGQPTQRRTTSLASDRSSQRESSRNRSAPRTPNSAGRRQKRDAAASATSDGGMEDGGVSPPFKGMNLYSPISETSLGGGDGKGEGGSSAAAAAAMGSSAGEVHPHLYTGGRHPHQRERSGSSFTLRSRSSGGRVTPHSERDGGSSFPSGTAAYIGGVGGGRRRSSSLGSAQSGEAAGSRASSASRASSVSSAGIKSASRGNRMPTSRNKKSTRGASVGSSASYGAAVAGGSGSTGPSSPFMDTSRAPNISEAEREILKIHRERIRKVQAQQRKEAEKAKAAKVRPVQGGTKSHVGGGGGGGTTGAASAAGAREGAAGVGKATATWDAFDSDDDEEMERLLQKGEEQILRDRIRAGNLMRRTAPFVEREVGAAAAQRRRNWPEEFELLLEEERIERHQRVEHEEELALRRLMRCFPQLFGEMPLSGPGRGLQSTRRPGDVTTSTSSHPDRSATIASAVPQPSPMTSAAALYMEKEIQQLFKTEARYRVLIQRSRIDGLMTMNCLTREMLGRTALCEVEQWERRRLARRESKFFYEAQRHQTERETREHLDAPGSVPVPVTTSNAASSTTAAFSEDVSSRRHQDAISGMGEPPRSIERPAAASPRRETDSSGGSEPRRKREKAGGEGDAEEVRAVEEPSLHKEVHRRAHPTTSTSTTVTPPHNGGGSGSSGGNSPTPSQHSSISSAKAKPTISLDSVTRDRKKQATAALMAEAEVAEARRRETIETDEVRTYCALVRQRASLTHEMYQRERAKAVEEAVAAHKKELEELRAKLRV